MRLREKPVFFLCLSAIALLPTVAQAAEEVQVQCAMGRMFQLRIDGRQAQVRSGDQQWTLARRPSALGQQFRGAQATLIIDGDFVAFVQKGDWNWRDCRIDGGKDVGLRP